MNPNRQISKKKVSLAILIVCLVGVWLLQRHQSVSEVEVSKSQPAPAIQVEPMPPEIAPLPETSEPQVEPAKPVALKSKFKTQKFAQNQPSQQPPKEPLHDPRARDALALVGIDQQAEQYWLQAIFDTNLPDKEREDLMEDLNEVGFTDPNNVTPDDLPLIVSRLQIIEQIEPNADPFMKEHLDEAYKDLAHMYAEVTGP